MKNIFKRIIEFFTETIMTDSLNEFIGRVKKEKCKVVSVQGVKAEKSTSHFPAIGTIGTFEYLLRFSAETPNKKKIIFEQKNFEKFGSNSGFGDATDRGKAAIMILLLAEKEVNNLKEKYHDLKIELRGPNGNAMDEKIFDKLHHDAKKYSVTI